jgi:GTP-binding protein
VLYKEIDGQKCEPIENVIVDVPEQYVGAVMEKLGARKGNLVDMQLHGTRQKLYYNIPTRCLFGYRSELLTDTRGEGLISSLLAGYEPFRGEIKTRFTSSLVASETGVATTYGLYQSQDRGPLFIGPATPVYAGMIVGENPKPDDIEVNVCKEKHLTAIRSSGADEKLTLITPVQLSLEEAIEFITEDELIEVTPKSIRLRKTILDMAQRKRIQAAKRAALKK